MDLRFDVIQQGVGDSHDLVASWDDNEPQIFKGEFTVYKEDKIVNIDGLARISVKMPGTGDDSTPSGKFTRDILNVMGDESSKTVEITTDDVFQDQRMDVTGKLGADIVARPSSDAYLIFGDPNYYFVDKIE